MWIILALCASLFWGLTYVFNEQVYSKISVFTSLGLTSIIVGVITLLISHFGGMLKPDLFELGESKKLLCYFIGGVGALLIAELFIGFSIVAKNATLAGLIEISYPIFIAIFSYILFKNNVSTPTIIGGVIIFIGIFVIYYFNH